MASTSRRNGDDYEAIVAAYYRVQGWTVEHTSNGRRGADLKLSRLKPIYIYDHEFGQFDSAPEQLTVEVKGSCLFIKERSGDIQSQNRQRRVKFTEKDLRADVWIVALSHFPAARVMSLYEIPKTWYPEGASQKVFNLLKVTNEGTKIAEISLGLPKFVWDGHGLAVTKDH